MINHPQIPKVALDAVTYEMKHLMFKWRNNYDIFKWCRQNDLISEMHHEDWFEKHQHDTSIKMYIVLDAENAYKPVGVCGLTGIDLVNQRAEFSLYISPDSQKSGLGKEALKLLCWHGFNAYPLHIIWGESFALNPALDMFTKIGFKTEGVRRDFYYREGKHINATMFSMKKDELKIHA